MFISDPADYPRNAEGKIDFAKVIGVDDSNFVHKFGFVDEIPINEFANGGPIVGVVREHCSEEQRLINRARVIDVATRIATRVENGL